MDNVIVVSKLWTWSFISACIGNFLLFFAFYMLVPIFPLFMLDQYSVDKTSIGVILSAYTLAALLIRPFAGFLLDMVYRKPVYLISYLLFILSFVGYPIANTIGLFLFFRILHGFTFGFVTTAGNSFVVDITPAERRGEGLGFFGVANTLAMAVGPMTGMYLHNYYDYDVIFYTAIGLGITGLIFASLIKGKKNQKLTEQYITWDRFFLFKGFRAGTSLMLMGIPYGMIVTYIALYGREMQIKNITGLFFMLMAGGLTASRFISGKMVDKGKLNSVVAWGTAISAVSLLLIVSLKYFALGILLYTIFLISAFVLGFGYGLLFPAYNTLFVNLAPNNRRATASSTYMTSWDIGVGGGLVLGGWLADSVYGLQIAYFAGALAALLSLLLYVKIAGPHFIKNKLR